MKITLDETGVFMPDAAIEGYVDRMLANKADIHVSQMLVIDCIRSRLIQIPDADRPEIQWEIYGKPVRFDKWLRSGDLAWSQHPLTDLVSKFLMELISAK